MRAQKDAGYDFLKIHPGLTAEEFDAMAVAARDVGMTFAGHVTASVGLRAALAAGQTTIDHLDGYMNVLTPDVEMHVDAAASFFGAALTPYVDPNLIAQAVSMTQTLGGAVVPTQTLLENTANAHRWQTMADRPQFKYLPRRLRAGYVERMQRTAAVTSPELGSGSGSDSGSGSKSEFLRIRRALIKALHDGGVPVLLGSDSPQIFNVPGFATHRELASMVAAGLTPLEALATGTTAPAAFFGTSDWGAIGVGRDADLVLLSRNPLDDIANTQRIEGVMVRGRWLDRARSTPGCGRSRRAIGSCPSRGTAGVS